MRSKSCRKKDFGTKWRSNPILFGVFLVIFLLPAIQICYIFLTFLCNLLFINLLQQKFWALFLLVANLLLSFVIVAAIDLFTLVYIKNKLRGLNSGAFKFILCISYLYSKSSNVVQKHLFPNSWY